MLSTESISGFRLRAKVALQVWGDLESALNEARSAIRVAGRQGRQPPSRRRLEQLSFKALVVRSWLAICESEFVEAEACLVAAVAWERRIKDGRNRLVRGADWPVLGLDAGSAMPRNR